MSDISAQSKSMGHLTTQAHEFVKQHVEYDIQNRAEYIYTIKADGIHNAPCSVVRYAYNGLTSGIVFMKEYSGIWNSAWETF